jgi:hypothetical protein
MLDKRILLTVCRTVPVGSYRDATRITKRISKQPLYRQSSLSRASCSSMRLAQLAI